MGAKSGSPGSLVDARRVPAGARAPSDGEFSYSVDTGPEWTASARPAESRGERRRGTRRRTRLRSGKIIDGEGRFLTECLVHDLSAEGGRLRLPPGVELPSSMRFFDDQTGLLHRVRVSWRRGREVGLVLDPPGTDPRDRALAEALRRKFYAVRG